VVIAEHSPPASQSVLLQLADADAWAARAIARPGPNHRRPAQRLMGVTYDAGALIAADRGERRMWARHRALLGRREVPTVLAPVLALSWRGSARQVQLARCSPAATSRLSMAIRRARSAR
jgi:hypothetical protein